MSFVNIFSQPLASLLILLKSFASISFVDHAYDVISKTASPYPRSFRFSPILLSMTFRVLHLNFRSMILWVNFCDMVKSVSWGCSVVQSCLNVCDLMDCRTPGFPWSSLSPRTWSNSCPLSLWCHPTISASVIPLLSCLQSFPASGSFRMTRFFTSGNQSIAASALASVLPMNIKDWFPLGCTGWISLQSKGLSRVFSNTTLQKHQFFGVQLSLWSNSHTHTCLLDMTIQMFLLQSNVSAF